MRVRADGCCGEDAGSSFEQRVDLGRRRGVLLRRVTLIASAGLTAAALALTLAGLMPVLAGRLAWGGTIWEAGPVLGWTRAALTARRVNWRLGAALAGVVVGLAWQPLVAALVALALLTERALQAERALTAERTPRPPRPKNRPKTETEPGKEPDKETNTNKETEPEPADQLG